MSSNTGAGITADPDTSKEEVDVSACNSPALSDMSDGYDWEKWKSEDYYPYMGMTEEDNSPKHWDWNYVDKRAQPPQLLVPKPSPGKNWATIEPYYNIPTTFKALKSSIFSFAHLPCELRMEVLEYALLEPHIVKVEHDQWGFGTAEIEQHDEWGLQAAESESDDECGSHVAESEQHDEWGPQAAESESDDQGGFRAAENEQHDCLGSDKIDADPDVYDRRNYDRLSKHSNPLQIGYRDLKALVRHPLTQVCRQLRYEALTAAFRANTFLLLDSNLLKDFMGIIGPDLGTFIKHVLIDELWDPPDYKLILQVVEDVVVRPGPAVLTHDDLTACGLLTHFEAFPQLRTLSVVVQEDEWTLSKSVIRLAKVRSNWMLVSFGSERSVGEW